MTGLYLTAILTAVNAITAIHAVSRRGHHAVGTTCRPRSRLIYIHQQQETLMAQFIRGGAMAIAILGTVSIAAAQQAPGNTHPQLTSNQQHAVNNGLASSPSQSAPSGSQPQVGDKVPDSMSAQQMPSNVSDQVPEVKRLLFVKLPDRIVLIDPDTQLVSEIVMNDDNSATTGSTTGGSATNTSNQPSNPSDQRPR
jgi:hypothetical protein